MTKRPGRVPDKGQRDYTRVVGPQHKHPRLNSLSQTIIPVMDGVVLPDDIDELCTYLDHNDLPTDDTNLLPKQNDDSLHRLRRQEHKIKALRAEKQALQRDLSRSRRLGRNLESDMARLRRQRLKELSNERRAKREIHAREEAVSNRERACIYSQETLVRLEATFQDEMYLYEQNEVKSVVRELVNRVELSTMMVNIQKTQEELAWMKLREQDLLDWTAQLEEKRCETEDFVIIERQVLHHRVESLETQLYSVQQRLQTEEQAGTELTTSCHLLQEEVACKSNWLTALALGSMSIVNVQEQIANRMEAERAEWQRSVTDLQQKYDELQMHHTKQLDQLQIEGAKLQEQLRVSQLSALNIQKQLQISQKTAKSSKTQENKLQLELKTLRTKFKTLEGELKL